MTNSRANDATQTDALTFAGHPSGRGHGPGGRLWPMRGDRIEIPRPMENDPPWDIVEVLDTDSDHRVMVRGHGYTVPRYLQRSSNGWRWPHLTTLGIRGSFCCETHGLIEPSGPLSNAPAGTVSGACGAIEQETK